jgi:hypothetical protein
LSSNTVFSWLLAGAFVAFAGCGQKPSSEKDVAPRAADAPPLVPDQSAAVCAAFEAKRVDPIWPETPDPETQRKLVESLEDRLSKAGTTETPALLMELGRAKARYTPAGRTPEARHAEARRGEFFYNEIGGDWLYQGKDFQELIRRFPGHDLEDDAAYEMTLLRKGGECEGWIPCYVSGQWEPLSTFLKAYPESPLADMAIERALAAFANVETDKDLRAATDSSDPEDIRKLTESLEAVGRAMPPSRKGRLLLRSAELWAASFDYNRTREAYGAALEAADAGVRGCAAARLEALPARWFTLDPIRVIHPQRVELTWKAPSSLETGYTVYRSTAKADAGSAVAQLTPDVRSWADTTTKPGTTYWYRVAATTRAGAVMSNPASAETPDLKLDVLGIAVSPTDKRLHVFGRLSNGFPQVVHVSPDGMSVERSNAEFIGIENGTARAQHASYVEDVWLVDPNSHRALPSGLSAVVRQGKEYLRYYPLTRENAGVRFLVSIDEKEDAAWISQGGGGVRVPVAMDCLAMEAVCWLGGENDVRLRDESGRVLLTVPLPQAGGNTKSATSVFADPMDASVWVVQGRAGRLLHIGRDGMIRQDMALAERTRSYSVRVTADFERRQVWFTRTNAAGKNELLRMDLNGSARPSLAPRVISEGIRSLSHLAPDLNGGLWVLNQQSVTRMDPNGRTLSTVELAK